MDETLEQFIVYREARPEMTFWQALLGFTQEKHDGSFSAILVEKNGRIYNTVNWTGEDNPAILFGDEVKK